MQKKQIMQFVALLILILAMTGAYFGIRSYQTKQEEAKSKKEAEAVIPLTAFEPDSVTAVRVDTQGTVSAFEKAGDQWKAADDGESGGLALDQDAFSDFLKTAGDIRSTTEVDAQEGEDYGFANPSRTVTITTKNGTSDLIFGMKNEMLDQYYVKTSESSRIYLVEESSYTAFDRTAEDFKQAETQTDDEDETDAD